MTKARDWRAKPKEAKGTSIRRKTPLGWPGESEVADRVVANGRARLLVIEELLGQEPSPGMRERLDEEVEGIKRALKRMRPALQKHLWPGA